MKLVNTVILGAPSLFHKGLASTLEHSHFRICRESDAFKMPLASGSIPAETQACSRRPDLYIIIDRAQFRDIAVSMIAKARNIGSDIFVVVMSEIDLDLSWAFDAGCDSCLPYSISPIALVMALDLVMLREVRVNMVGYESASPLPISTDSIPIPEKLPLPQFLLPPTPSSRIEKLSPREEEVLRSIALGHSNKTVGRRLGIEEATVKGHVRTVLRKIGASNRTQAAVWVHVNDGTGTDFLGQQAEPS